MAHTIPERHQHPKYPKLKLEQRSSSRFWQARAYVAGQVQQKSTKHHELRSAFRIAESWYRDITKAAKTEPDVLSERSATMQQVYLQWRVGRTEPQRAEAEKRWSPIAKFWKALRVEEITARTFHEFYQWRRHKTPTIKAHTLSKDLSLIRPLIRYAVEQGVRDSLPVVPRPGRVERNPRPWLTRAEWATLREMAYNRQQEARNNPKLYRQRVDLADFCDWMIESMMRVDEVRKLTVGQVRVIREKNKKLHCAIDVRGKTGHRTAIAGRVAVNIYERRANGRKPTDLLWEHGQRDAFRELLKAANLRADSFGTTRNLKSLRCTSIALYLLANPTVNLNVVSKNSGTSLQMLNDFYLRRLTPEMHANELNRSIVLD